MAALDFPSSPAVGTIYPSPAVPGQPQYTYDGEKWTSGTSNGAIYVSDTPPPAPVNSLWWESDTGIMYVRYNDGSSTQWVSVANSNFNQSLTDARYVIRSGDVMTGPLTTTAFTASYGVFNGTGSSTTIGTFGAAGNCLEVLIDGSSNAMIQSFNRTSGTWRPFKIASGVLTLDTNGAGATITYGLTVTGPITTNQSATQGTIHFSSSGTRYIYYDGATFNFTGGKIGVDVGYQFRAGSGGATNGQTFNIFWDTTPAARFYVDNVYVGNLTISSDYRIKKDVIDLPTMWDTVKALRPIKYTQAEFAPPAHAAYMAAEALKARKEAEENPDAEPREVNTGPMFQADDIERWGFIAHELQETLTPTAATGVKDAPNEIQSPNPFTVIAALTKALQEAMTRIEALEAANGV